MPECSPVLNSYKDWSCTNRHGKTAAEAASLRSTRFTVSAVADAVLAGELSMVGTALSQDSRKHLAIVITCLASLACCAMYCLRRLCNACRQYISSHHDHRPLPVNEVRGRFGTAPRKAAARRLADDEGQRLVVDRKVHAEEDEVVSTRL